MPHRLLIRLSADGATDWVALSRDGAVLQGPAAGLPDPGADEVVLLLPAEQVLLLDTPRIGGSRAQLAQALPYAIEDQLIAPVETQHVAFDERGDGDRIAVAVIDRARLQQALDRLRDAGLPADRAYAESQLLPHAPTALWLDPPRAVLRWAPATSLVVAIDELPAMWRLLADAGDTPAPPVLFGDAALLPPGIEVASHEAMPSPLRWLAARLPSVVGPNLLQGDFRPPRRQAHALGLWRWAAGLAAAALLFALAGALIERRQLESVVAERQAEMEQLLREAVPGVQRVVDPVAQLRIELQRLGQANAGGALPLLGRVAPVIAGSGRYTLEAVDYRGQSLELVITAADVAALDSLRESLAALPPLQVELTSATPGSRGVEGRLRIRGGGA